MNIKYLIAIGYYLLSSIICFSVGDELGFAESLGNLEGSKRRSLNQREHVNINNNVGVLPASKMIPSQQYQIRQNKPKAVVAWPPPQQPTLSSRLLQLDTKPMAPSMTEAVSLPLGVPAFRPIPSKIAQKSGTGNGQDTFNRKMTVLRPIQNSPMNLTFLTKPTVVIQSLKPTQKESVIQKIPPPATAITPSIPPFQTMPASLSRISTGQVVQIDSGNDYLNRNSVYQTNNVEKEKNAHKQDQPVSSQLNLPQVDLMGHTVEELAAVANVSVEAIQRAIQMKQQQLLIEQQAKLYQEHMETLQVSTPRPTRPSTIPTTTTATTTVLPTKRYTIAGGNKVMNAPREYYPVGYEKNFDDNFISKVDLPQTSFHCGDQKHFPGLYADMDLGCMVFHVCALTDDGLIMKSFLCPESTLFDQTILKCNWWFYVDCKSSRNLYDSNLPVSKSYQLMKALTFFSKYKNSQGENDGVDVEALKNSVASSKET